jgi:hypothetical protein
MEEKSEPWLIKAFKNRKKNKIIEEIELLKLEIEKAKLEKQLKEV